MRSVERGTRFKAESFHRLRSGRRRATLWTLGCIGVALTSAVSAQVAPPSESPHAYFQELSALPQCKAAFSLRDQAQLDLYSGRHSSAVTYDFANDPYPYKQDAAKVPILEDKVSLADQVRLPIDVDRGKVLITWDAWWGPEYASAELRGGLTTHKTFQVASPVDNSERWLEIRNGYARADSGAVSATDTRPYCELGPGTYKGGGDSIQPQVGQFQVRPRTWTRYWVQVELLPGSYDRVSLWMADETTNPVMILNGAEMQSAGVITRLWIEFNSSQSRLGPRLIAYVRNVVVLKDVADPQSLFRRPGTSEKPPLLPSMRSPSNLRVMP